MVKRDIDESMILAVLDAPLWTPFSSNNPRYDGVVADGRRLVAIVADEHMPPVVVTAWWYDEALEQR